MTYTEQKASNLRLFQAGVITENEYLARQSFLETLANHPSGHRCSCSKFGQAGDCASDDCEA